MKRLLPLLMAAVVMLPASGQTQTVPPLTYFLAEGATGSFFDTDILIANPHDISIPVTLTFLKEDGTTITQDRLLSPTSRTTIRVDTIPGLEATSMSTLVTSTSGAELIVERTMRWDASGYGAHTDKATSGAATEWFFAEGAQGFFFTYLLLVNPHASANVAHVTYLREGAPPITRDYPLTPSSRFTIFAGDVAELVNTSFGSRVTFDQPGVAERAMYFGESPLFNGGHGSAGVTAPATEWFLAEGATGGIFVTYVLLANPGTDDAEVTLTYLPASGAAIVKNVTLPAGQRMTRDISTEDPALQGTVVGARITSNRPIVVERAQYWPHPAWYETHNSFGLTESATRWGLAEGRVGGTSADQTYILLANPGSVSSEVQIRFLRTNGAVVTKSFTVGPTSRLNVAVNGPGSDVPELANESFGAVIEATQPIAVERSLYSNVAGVIWAAGTNATATRLSPPVPLTVSVEATDDSATEAGLDPGTLTFTRSGGNPAAALSIFYTIGGTATNGNDYSATGSVVSIPAGQTSATVTITPFADNLAEGSETMTVTINPHNNYTIGTPNTATVTISDSVATVNVTAADAAASEPGTDTAMFTFTRTAGGNAAAALSIFYTIGGTATNGNDYSATGSTVVIPANQTSATVIITPFADNLVEGAETMSVTINPHNAYAIGAQNAAAITIADSVVTVNVTATDADASEPGTDIARLTFTRTTGGNPAVALSVFYTIAGTATNGNDYSATGSTVVIPANQTSATVTITPFADNLVEGAETMTVTINPSSTYAIGAQNAAAISIADSVTTVTIVATDDTASEAGGNTGTFTFTRTAGGNPAAALTIFYTISGTATNGNDYAATGSVVTIPANQTTATVTITPFADAAAEGTETVILTINNSSTYVIGVANTATVSILNN
jgi:hypothetical protein